MMCDKCGKNSATTHIKTVVNGKVRQMNLCAECAAAEGYGNLGNLSLANMLTSMFGESIENGGAVKERCKCCGCSFSDIVESGRVGCSECYTTFKKELMPSLNRLHGKVQHIGAVPKKMKSIEKAKEEEIESLKNQLKTAVENEEYEKAAELRDKIRKLEGKE